ncbi:MAG TPA: hypothetical protein PK205_14170 [Promineifilum sp.]|nr:hypothetical protein [Promineifilum sp.]
MARSKKPAAPQPPEWVSLPHELYAATCAELVTFSHKTVNSNAPAGGIRLAPEQGLKLRYVSARTLLGAGEVPALDYPANAGKTAKAVKQLNQLREGSATAPADEAKRILATLAEATSRGTQISTDKVSLRARQLLLPKEGGYVAVTPLTAGGVNRKLRAQVRQHNDRLREAPDDTRRRIPVAVFGLGGSKPQNVGSLARDMQRPLVFFAPTENRQVKAILALHFQGMRIRLPGPLLSGFRDWCADSRRRHGGLIPTDMTTRDEEIVHIRDIAWTVLAQGEVARQRLLAHRELLPAGGSPLVSAEAAPLNRGLVDPELRDKDWPRTFAQQLAGLIADHRFGNGQEEFQFEQADIHELQAMIEEVAG